MHSFVPRDIVDLSEIDSEWLINEFINFLFFFEQIDIRGQYCTKDNGFGSLDGSDLITNSAPKFSTNVWFIFINFFNFFLISLFWHKRHSRPFLYNFEQVWKWYSKNWVLIWFIITNQSQEISLKFDSLLLITNQLCTLNKSFSGKLRHFLT